MILLTASLTILTIIVLIIIIKQRWNSLVTMILVPFLLFNISFSWYTINDLWGAPKEGLPTNSFQIVYAKVLKPWIYILTVEPDKNYPVFRIISWTEENQKEIEKGQRGQKAGKRMLAKKKEGSADDSQLQMYEWDHKQSIPK